MKYVENGNSPATPFAKRTCGASRCKCSYFCIGMNASTAFNVFARAVVRERKIPFEIVSPKQDVTRKDGLQAFMALRSEAKYNGVQDLSLDDINAEINLARGEGDNQ